MLPLSKMTPMKVTGRTPLEVPGFFLPLRPGSPPALAFNWGDAPRLILLEGSHAFYHFQQQTGHHVDGLLITDVEFRADQASLYDPSREGSLLGSLILHEGELSIVGINPNNNLGDEHLVPLWGDYAQASEDVKLGFTRWSIVARDGDERVTLWATPEPEAGEVV